MKIIQIQSGVKYTNGDNDDLLRAAGIRGRRGSPMCCPLARATNTGVYAAVRVSGGREIPLTQPQIVFVGRLDRGKYPDLIEGT